MAYFKFIAVAVLSLFAVGAHAGYAQVSPPAGWSQSSGSSAFWTHGAANDVSYKSSVVGSIGKVTTVRTSAALNVGGQPVKVLASMRFAANAGRFAASALCLNPLSIGIIGLQWLASECIDYKAGKFMLTCGPDGAIETPPPPVQLWFNPFSGLMDQPSAQAACEAGSPSYYAGQVYEHSSYFTASCFRAGDISVGSTYSLKPPPPPPAPPPFTPVEISNADIIEKMAPRSIPVDLPAEIPTVPLPVDDPVLNPGPDDLPSPVFIPTGNPVPTSEPEVFNQPGLIVIPAPLPSDFWRVDIQPKTIPQNSPDPKTQEQLNPLTGPKPSASAVAVSNPGLCDQYPNIAACAPAAPPEAKKKFCEDNPELLVCQPDDVPDVPELEKKEFEMSFAPDAGWGSGGGSCPADKVLTHATLSFRPYCDFMSGIRPAIIALAWFVGALILIGKK